MPRVLPYVEPMLATLGDSFDSPQHLFEVKWDGFRALATTDDTGLKLRSRRQLDMTERFKDLAFLAGARKGLALDGEIVALTDGRPDFERLLGTKPGPVFYMVFDVLYADYTSLMALPLTERRVRLADIVRAIGDPRISMSEGVIGSGKAFFAQLVARGFEGVVGKRLDSVYEAGQRSGAWVKVKRTHTIQCAVLGYFVEGNDLRSLALAAPDADGALRYVGRCGSGLDESARRALLPRLRARPRTTPLIACDEDARWVEPGVYCVVKFVERSKSGHLRAPVFVRWIEA
jgi:bifunctional non-homologous end joining protein LigD